jgi:hypothetical protein
MFSVNTSDGGKCSANETSRRTANQTTYTGGKILKDSLLIPFEIAKP